MAVPAPTSTSSSAAVVPPRPRRRRPLLCESQACSGSRTPATVTGTYDARHLGGACADAPAHPAAYCSRCAGILETSGFFTPEPRRPRS